MTEQYLPNDDEYTYALEKLIDLVLGKVQPIAKQKNIIEVVRVLRSDPALTSILLLRPSNVLDWQNGNTNQTGDAATHRCHSE